MKFSNETYAIAFRMLQFMKRDDPNFTKEAAAILEFAQQEALDRERPTCESPSLPKSASYAKTELDIDSGIGSESDSSTKSHSSIVHQDTPSIKHASLPNIPVLTPCVASRTRVPLKIASEPPSQYSDTAYDADDECVSRKSVKKQLRRPPPHVKNL